MKFQPGAGGMDSELNRPTLVLLPGMDGTGKLFRGLTEVIPPQWPHRLLAYPADRVLSYQQTLDLVQNDLANERQMVLLAESYSGPIALRFAAAHPARVTAVVLCASFIHPPLPSWVRWVVGPWMFSCHPPKLALRALMVGRNAPDAVVSEVRAAIAMVRPKVLASRVKDVLRLDCSDALRTCAAPLLYLAGTRDFLVRRRSRDEIRAVKSNVKICSIDGPHLLLQIEPIKAWSEIELFLNDLYRGQWKL
jgi:pimeloyl-[acyl-carrier protein] methyl ester esterase